ncbi:hypothetical protein pb186bvf_005175 [Paramecium bursaria]
MSNEENKTILRDIALEIFHIRKIRFLMSAPSKDIKELKQQNLFNQGSQFEGFIDKQKHGRIGNLFIKDSSKKFRQPGEDSYQNFRTLYQLIDCAQLDIQSLSHKPRSLIAGFMYLVLGEQHGLFNRDYIRNNIPYTSKFLTIDCKQQYKNRAEQFQSTIHYQYYIKQICIFLRFSNYIEFRHKPQPSTLQINYSEFIGIIRIYLNLVQYLDQQNKKLINFNSNSLYFCDLQGAKSDGQRQQYILAMNNIEFDLVYIFLLVRCNNLLEQCPQQNRREYKNVIKELKGNMNQWMVIDNHELKIFLAQLMLGATRGFEGYDFFLDPEKKIYFKHDPRQDILQSIITINQFIRHPPKLKPFSKTYLFRIIKTTIQVICQREINDEIIDQYFNQTTFIEFTHESLELAGLSSYHGNITYINDNLSLWQTLITIIHEFGHNISRFLIELGYFCHRDQEYKQLEAGNFLEFKLFAVKDNGSGPFGLKKFIRI